MISDVLGVSGAAMLEAMVLEGKTDPAETAGLARGTLRQKKEAMAGSLTGFQMPETHRFLIRQARQHLATLVEHIEELDRQIQSHLIA